MGITMVVMADVAADTCILSLLCSDAKSLEFQKSYLMVSRLGVGNHPIKTWHRNTVGAHAIDLALKDHVNSVHYMANTTIDCSQKIAEAAASLLLPSNPYPMTQYKY